jgi:superfamily II DNA or RNA helicase
VGRQAQAAHRDGDGTGKTIVFGHACLNALARDLRVMIVAHRSELIEQAAHKVFLITGIEPAIEKAEAWATKHR